MKFSLTFPKEQFSIFFNLEKYVLIFFRIFFISKNYIFCKIFLLLRPNICSGIQKSYLEQRAMILKSRKTKKPFCKIIFFPSKHQISILSFRYPLYRAGTLGGVSQCLPFRKKVNGNPFRKKVTISVRNILIIYRIPCLS